MGRKPVNANLPKGMRARKQRSGAVWYYLDVGGKPRREIALGSDYVTAVQKWADLMQVKPAAITFEQLADRYQAEVLPTHAKNTQYTQRSDLKKLREFFCNPVPAPLNQIRPMHIAQLLEWKKSQPTTANRLKRVFSALWNQGRAWGYTDLQNPATGVSGLSEGKRTYDVSESVYRAIWEASCAPLRDAMDLAYLTGQRPGDAVAMTEHDVVDGMLLVSQHKTGAKVRIRIEGELAALMKRISARKKPLKVWHSALIVDERGMGLSLKTLQRRFSKAREKAAADHPEMPEIAGMWFYDLRAKAAADTTERDGIQAAADLLGHRSVATTKGHYDRRGKSVGPTR